MKRGRTLPAKTGDEYDAFSPWCRKYFCCFNNSTGLMKYWKRRYQKRVRRVVKSGLMQEVL